MKATGIIRRIDELGRIVIPKEIRKNLKIKEGSTLEIFINDANQLVLEKVDTLKSLNFEASLVASCLSENLQTAVFVTDTDNIVAGSKINKNILEAVNINSAYAKILETRKFQKLNTEVLNTMLSGLKTETNKYSYAFILPIIIDSEIAGSICVLESEERKEPEIKFSLNLISNLITKN